MAVRGPASLDPEPLDAADPLAAFRERFVVPDPASSTSTATRWGGCPAQRPRDSDRVVGEEWGGELIRGWEAWLELPLRVGDRLAEPLLGARAGRGGRHRLDDGQLLQARRWPRSTPARAGGPSSPTAANFPTDRYVLEGLAARRAASRSPGSTPTRSTGPQPRRRRGRPPDDVALVTLSHVNYRSAAIADMAAITALAHDGGRARAVGPEPLRGRRSRSISRAPASTSRSAAPTSTSTAGPGAPALLYVREALQAELRNPIQGWFGRRDQFAMGQGYEPRARDRRAGWSGRPGSSRSRRSRRASRLMAEAGIDRIRAKGVALTEYAIALHRRAAGAARLRARVARAIPLVAAPMSRSGILMRARLTARAHRGAASSRTSARPTRSGSGLSPLTTSYRDVAAGIAALEHLVA